MESDMDTTSEERSSTETSTESSDDDEKLETTQLCGVRLQLPQGLCERKEIFDEFFAPSTWNSFSEIHKRHLRKFLPTFPHNDDQEKKITLQRLFTRQVFRFNNNPLDQFHEHLKAGHFRPDIAKMRQSIQRAELKELKFRHTLHRERLKREVCESRNKLLNLAKNLPPSIDPKIDRLCQNTPAFVNPIGFRTKRRYFKELAAIREQFEEQGYSSDENYPEGPPAPLSKKQKRHLNLIRASISKSDVVSTIVSHPNSLDLERIILPNHNPFCINEETYKNLLLSHKRRKLDDSVDPHLDTTGITLSKIINRTDLASFKKLNVTVKQVDAKHKRKRREIPSVSQSPDIVNKINPVFGQSSQSEIDSDSDSMFDVKTPNLKYIKKEIKIEPADTDLYNNKANLAETKANIKPLFGKVTPATLSDLDGIDMMNLPIDLEDSNIDILEFDSRPELMQDTHVNFLCLIRDIICSTPDHRMSMAVLEERLHSWQENPISPLNDWYCLSNNWIALLPLAIDFLSGNCSEQPDDFVPYIEYKTKIDMYQWIGAGRDSDILLIPLCQFWFEHRADMKPSILFKDKEDGIEVSDRSHTPPPPRCPTTWSIRKASSEEIKSYQEQERQRYVNPHKAFTFKCNGYESVVGPVKGAYNQQNAANTKARGHSILTYERPNYVTILTLVRDATARLPNGEGTRADICELLRASQYISQQVPESSLQSVVSGALDRMHTQFDPCVKYDSKRKVWIYLHRNRSEGDFERIHQQYQRVNKMPKKAIKLKPKIEKSQPKSTEISIKTEPVAQPNPEPPPPPPQPATKLLSHEQPPEQKKPTVKQPQTLLPPTPENIVNEVQISTTPLTKHPKVKKNLKVASGKSLNTPNTVNAAQKQQDKKEPSKQLPPKQFDHKPPPKQFDHKVFLKQIDPKVPPKQDLKPPLKQLDQKMPPKQLDQKPLPKLQDQKAPPPKQAVEITQPKLKLQQKHLTEPKVQVKVSQPSLLQTSSHIQNIKGIAFLKSTTQGSIVTPTVVQSKAVQSSNTVSTSLTLETPIQEKVIQTTAQNKTQPRLTLAQQQQILHSLKQKVLPVSQTVTSAQYKAVNKSRVAAGVPVQKTVAVSLVDQTKSTTSEAGISKHVITSPAPLVAKVLTNAAGQVISVESLLAHQKQHGSLPQGTTLRISGTKGGQANLIQLSAPITPTSAAQITGTSNTAGTSQPKIPTTEVISSAQTTTQTVKNVIKSATKVVPRLTQQIVSAKFIAQNVGQKVVTPKVLVTPQNQIKVPTSSKNVTTPKTIGINVGANAGTIRMLNAGNINIAQLGGKPVLISSKGTTFQSLQGQNIILQTEGNPSNQGLILSNNTKTVTSTQSSTNVNIPNQQHAQVILSPPLKVQQSPRVVLSSAIKPTSVQTSTGSQLVLGGQAVRVHAAGASTPHRVVLAGQNQGQIITQQILLPVGFQGTPFNIKTLQGLKVVPIAHAPGKGIQGRQVFARIMNPANIVRVTQSNESVDVGNLSNSTAE